MKKYIVLAVILYAFTGCSGMNLIIHGQVDGNNYISKEAEFIITPPTGWYPTLTPPSPDTEQKISAKLKRKRELGYIAKTDGTGYIIIETYWLTWGGRPIVPTDITWDPKFLEKFKEVCEKWNSMEQKRSKDKFSSYTFECAELITRSRCLIFYPCLESTKKMASKKNGWITTEKIYIFGRSIESYLTEAKRSGSGPPEINMPDDAHGWRVRFTLVSPPGDYQQNIAALEEVIGSMSKY